MRVLQVLILGVGLVWGGAAFAVDDTNCSAMRTYTITDEDGKVRSEMSFKRDWGLTCIEETQLYYAWLAHILNADPTAERVKALLRSDIQQMGDRSILNR